jgi:hypothetical protein
MSMGDRKAALIRCTGVGLVDAKAKFRNEPGPESSQVRALPR